MSTPVEPSHAPWPSERFLAAVGPFPEVVLVSHVNPDPDALASMFGISALLKARQPGKPVTLTHDGLIARAENQAMVRLLSIPIVPLDRATQREDVAVVMVDSQPHTGRRASEAARPVAVIDHHETGGVLDGVAYIDLRSELGATSTIITGYLIEQHVPVGPLLATALLYGIESEITGFPREAGPADDGALVWLYPRADKDLLAQIRNPRLPLSYFAAFQQALSNAFLYGDAIVCWCGTVPQPDLIAEIADFLIRFEQVRWVVCLGLFQDVMKLSVRTSELGLNAGEVLRTTLNGMGTAGGHDKRAGGAISVKDSTPEAIDQLRKSVCHRFLIQIHGDTEHGRRLLGFSPVVPVP